MQAEAWMGQSADELQPVVLFPEPQDDLTSDEVCSLCHTCDIGGKSASNGFPDFLLQQQDQPILRGFQLFWPVAGEAAAVFSQLGFVHG